MDKDNDGRSPKYHLPKRPGRPGQLPLSSIWWSFPVRSNSGYDACGSARQHLQHALGIFESLPAPLWVQRARSELSRVGLRPPAPLALTATEERVAAGRIRPHQPAGRPGPFSQSPYRGGQPRPGLPQAGGVTASRRGDGPQRARAAPALTATSGDQDSYTGGWPAETASSGQNSASPVKARRRFAPPPPRTPPRPGPLARAAGPRRVRVFAPQHDQGREHEQIAQGRGGDREALSAGRTNRQVAQAGPPSCGNTRFLLTAPDLPSQ